MQISYHDFQLKYHLQILWTSMKSFNLIRSMHAPSVNRSQIESETSKDTILKEIVNKLKTGENLETIGLQNYEYTLQEGYIFKGHRIVIPKTLQLQVLKELHVGHLRKVKMKLLA